MSDRERNVRNLCERELCERELWKELYRESGIKSYGERTV